MKKLLQTLFIVVLVCFIKPGYSQFNLKTLNNFSVNNATSLKFGPDGRLYVSELEGNIKALTIERTIDGTYQVIHEEVISLIKNIANHNDDGTSSSSTVNRQITGIYLSGSINAPVIYVTSSDPRWGGPSGDKNLDTNSGVISRLTWKHSQSPSETEFNQFSQHQLWEKIDLVRGLPRSEENHSINGIEKDIVNGTNYLYVCVGGLTNAGSPSKNFTKITEYALSAAVISVNLDMINTLPIKTDGINKYIYDLPTLDDPTRNNLNGINDPNLPGYTGIDIGDPWGGNDGLNQAKIIENGPVQIYATGFRNAYDLIITSERRMYVTDNGANQGWGGLPFNEGPPNNDISHVTNQYNVDENGFELGSGSGAPAYNGQTINNQDHMHLITGYGTGNIDNYIPGLFYGGHPTPIRANPTGAGLYTHWGENSDNNGYFRTQIYDPNSSDTLLGPQYSLPVDWPPVPLSMAHPIEGDYLNPGNGLGEDNSTVVWGKNTNAIAEYTASNLEGAYQGNLFAGSSLGGGKIFRVQLNPDGSVISVDQQFATINGGFQLGIECQSDTEIFAGTIWTATYNEGVKILEPTDYDGANSVTCYDVSDPLFDALADYDGDGFTNQDEIDNGTDYCSGSQFPDDYDGDQLSDLNDPDDDNDGLQDHLDVFQLDPNNGVATVIPYANELFNSGEGFYNLNFTGIMTNLDPADNYILWLDQPGDSPVDDIYGGATGTITVHMTSGDAYQNQNNQEKAFQFGLNVDQNTGVFSVQGRMLPPFHTFLPGQSQGVFIGTGDQDNYLKVIRSSAGIEVVYEENGVINIENSYTFNKSTTTYFDVYFKINPAIGSVQPAYAVGDNNIIDLGNPIILNGNLLNAIQSNTESLAVGIIGTNAGGSEFAANYDFFNVSGETPYITFQIPDLDIIAGSENEIIDLNAHFNDDNGTNNLIYTVENNSWSSVSASISGNLLTLSFPVNESGEALITIRATDLDDFFAEQTFRVAVNGEPNILYRINAGGNQIAAIETDGSPFWNTDTKNAPSSYVNSGSNTFAGSITSLHSSVPATTPLSVFQSERWDPASGAEMLWSFPVPAPGIYEIRLFMGNSFSGTSAAGQRVFDVLIENNLVFNDIDLSLEYGHQVGGMKSYLAEVTDGVLNIEFIHQVENPLVNAIEILSYIAPSGNQPPSIVAIDNQTNLEGATINLQVQANDADNDALNYSINGQPAGITINQSSGLISGTLSIGTSTGGANSDGVYNVSVSVTDNNDTTQTSFVWTVTAPNTLTGNWLFINDGTSCSLEGEPGSCPQGRHEAAYVQIGDKFYLVGGREHNSNVNIYDPATDSWTVGAAPPVKLHHFQAIEHEGLLYVVGAMTGNFPNEPPVNNLYIYNPSENQWYVGPEIPQARRRGSAGVVKYNGKIYMVSGIQNGHIDGWVPWFDEYDPATNTWTALPDAPRSRDHFHAAVVNGKLYLAAGRRSNYGGPNGTFSDTEALVDVYDFSTNSWTTLTNPIPTERAGNTVAVLNNDLIVIGGEKESGNAKKETEALNTETGEWRNLAPLNTGRHGTQAIVNNGGIYLASGSPKQGGGQLLSQEAFYLGEQTSPVGNVLVASNLATDFTEIIFDIPVIGQVQNKQVVLSNTDGNQGILITNIVLNGSSEYSFDFPFTLPYVLPANGQVILDIVYSPASTETSSMNLTISHSGANEDINIGNGFLQAASLISINTGTNASLVLDATEWSADQFFSGGKTFQTNVSIANTSMPELYQSERFGNFSYAIPVANGSYQIDLHFAEIYWQTAGSRVFNVSIEGTEVLSNYDIVADVGSFIAVIKSFDFDITDGEINITLTTVTNNAKISAIQILPVQQTNYNLTIDQQAYNFGNEVIGYSSLPRNFNINNPSDSNILITNIQLSGQNPGDFILQNLLENDTIYAGTGKVFDISFSPDVIGAKNSSLIINYSGSTDSLLVNLSGNGILTPISLDKTSYTFSNTAIGDSALTDFTITNLLDQELSVNSVTINGSESSDYNLLNLAENTIIGSNSSLVFSALFSPQSDEPQVRTAQINLLTNKMNQSQSIQLSGQAIQPILVSSDSIGFGQQIVGVASSTYNITITNNSTKSKNIGTISLTGNYPTDFSFSGIQSGDVINANSELTFGLIFTPESDDPTIRDAVFALVIDGQTFEIKLNGEAIAVPMALDQYSFTYPLTTEGEQSIPANFNLFNNLNEEVIITDILSIGDSDDFTLNNLSVNAIVPANGSLAFDITFNPISENPNTKSAQISILYNKSSIPLVIDLTGTTVGRISVTPTELNFDTQAVGFDSNPQIVEITNNATTDIVINSLIFSGNEASDFTLNGFTAGSAITAGTTANLEVVFNPVSDNPVSRNANLEISYEGSVTMIALNGQAVGNPVTSDITVYSFNQLAVGESSDPVIFTLTNLLNQEVSITDISISGSESTDFSIIGLNINDLIVPNGQLAFSVVFSPLSADPTLRSGVISIMHDRSPVPIVIELGGQSIESFTITPMMINFGSQSVGAQSNPQTITFINNSSADILIDAISISGINSSDFIFSGLSSGDLVLAGNAVNIDVIFTPGSADPISRSATLSITCKGQTTAIPLDGESFESPAVLLYRINTGQNKNQVLNSEEWLRDQFFIGGRVFKSNKFVNNTDILNVYQTERFGNMSYEFPVGNGLFEVRLHFAEIYWTENGKRVFNVTCEGNPILTNFDLVADSGPFNAIEKVFQNINVSDGSLSLSFTAVIDNAKVSGIEIFGPETSLSNARKSIEANELSDAANNITHEVGVKLYPNPNQGNFSLSINNPDNESVSYMIFNSLGSLLIRKDLTNDTSVNTNISLNSKGVYIIKLQIGDQVIQEKIVVQ